MPGEKAAKFHTGTANVERSVENLIQSDQCCSLLHSIKPKDSMSKSFGPVMAFDVM